MQSIPYIAAKAGDCTSKNVKRQFKITAEKPPTISFMQNTFKSNFVRAYHYNRLGNKVIKIYAEFSISWTAHVCFFSYAEFIYLQISCRTNGEVIWTFYYVNSQLCREYTAVHSK